jgi:hypothetical protein
LVVAFISRVSSVPNSGQQKISTKLHRDRGDSQAGWQTEHTPRSRETQDTFGNGEYMSRLKKTIASFFLISSLILGPISWEIGAAATDNPEGKYDPMTMTIDLVICRPLGLVALLGGTLVFVVSSPFSALGGNIEGAWDSLVVDPAEFTFKRQLGKFD